MGIISVTNKVVSSLNLQTIKKYIKNTNHIDAEKVEVPCLLQSKSYLKIIDIFYILKNTNTSISADVIKSIIKSNYIFNNIAISLRSYIIKVFLKSDMVIIWQKLKISYLSTLYSLSVSLRRLDDWKI